MIAVDSNLLVYGHREVFPWHHDACARLIEVDYGSAGWAIQWKCIKAFLSIVTHPRIYAPPTPLVKAIDQVEAWLESPNLVLLSESEGYWPELRSLLQTGRVSGPQVHDARIAALCRQHGVSELWSIDRDFSRFPGLIVRNPLVG